jgi:methylenetetrahydrofolate dehydrogenase (NADP+)/methenyltetrahydrofolate cyclohydrolase
VAAILFDGKAFGAGILRRVRDEVAIGGKPLKIATIYNSNNEASRIYTKIKSRTARELGVLFEAHDVTDFQRVSEAIKVLNRDNEVQGIMVQLPLIDKKTDERLCQMIRKEKDVDGLNPVSKVIPATVRAAAAIISEGLSRTGKDGNWPLTMIVIGSKGNVGKGIMNFYKGDVRYKLIGAGRGEIRPEEVKRADIVVSASGQTGLIVADMIKPGAVVVDIGYPGGDMRKDVETIAGFYTPVPGGVGPVTVAMLYRNLADIAQLQVEMN